MDHGINTLENVQRQLANITIVLLVDLAFRKAQGSGQSIRKKGTIITNQRSVGCVLRK